MKKIIYIIIFLLLVSFVYADKVIIFNFNYDNDQIILKEQFVKEGYYPDRKIESVGEYNCSLLDNQGKSVYSFNFDIPPKIFTDTTENYSTVGSVIILSQTDFSFVSPYLDNATKIMCYNPRGYEILKENIQKITLGPEITMNKWIYAYVVLALIGLIILIYLNKRKK